MMRGDVYFADLKGNYGSEQGGYRPVVIIQNDIGNKYSPTVIVAILTTKIKKSNMPTHVFVTKEEGMPEDSVILLEQIRTLDKRRLKNYITTLDDKKMREIDAAIMISLGIVGTNRVAEFQSA